jgi:3-oxoacyl-[acyl-carrier protein] reductase
VGRRVVVSGGGTGIGRAVAHRAVARGDDVVIIGRHAETLEQAASDLAGTGPGSVVTRTADLTRPHQVEAVAATIDGPVDAIVNNAGGVASRSSRVPGLPGVADAWQADFAANVLTAVLLTEALLPKLRRPGGRIVAVSSIAALRGGGGSYSAAKAALHGWVFSLAAELGPQGVTANVVAPGYTQGTGFFANTMTEARHRRLVDQTAVGRPGHPDDVAAAVCFLASEDAAHITGEILQVNGGALFGR